MKQFCTWSTQQHTASFWDNLGKSVKECQIILDFTAAKGDGGGGGDTGHLHLAPVKSSPAHQHSDFSQAGCPSCHPTQCHSIKTWDIFVKKKQTPNTILTKQISKSQMLPTNITYSVWLQQWYGFWPLHGHCLATRKSSIDVHVCQCYTVKLEHLLKAVKIYHLYEQQVHQHQLLKTIVYSTGCGKVV